jgi:hypothetical protein
MLKPVSALAGGALVIQLVVHPNAEERHTHTSKPYTPNPVARAAIEYQSSATSDIVAMSFAWPSAVPWSSTFTLIP